MKNFIAKNISYILSIAIIFLSSITLFVGKNYLFSGVLAFIFFHFFLYYSVCCLLKKIKATSVPAIFPILFYEIISLTLIYYSVGLSPFSIFIWILITLFLSFIFLGGTPIMDIDNLFCRTKSRHLYIPITCLIIYLVIIFLASPIDDGWPSPWPRDAGLIFLIFLLLFIIISIFVWYSWQRKNSNFINYFLLFSSLSLIALRYHFAYGYDTLLHQASLDYIARHGQITPLSPFYIGQYSLEIFLHFFTGLNFVFIERWFLPVLSAIVLIETGKYFLNFISRSHAKNFYFLIPLSVIILIPSLFVITSPSATSLIFTIPGAVFLYVYFLERDKSIFYLALGSSISAVLIHPFIGLNILIWVLSSSFLRRESPLSERIIYYTVNIFISSFFSTLCFIFYNFLSRGLSIHFLNPITNIDRFFKIFKNPLWYSIGGQSFGILTIYFFEKISLFLFLFISVLIVISCRKKLNYLLLFVTFSFVLSSLIFVSIFDSASFYDGDKINYGYRLFQISKWIIWPIILFGLFKLFFFLRDKSLASRASLIFIFSVFFLLGLYLTYPRYDSISVMSANSIRSVDYDALDIIHNRENGKDGYLVLSNQILGAGAVKKFGFGPYYKLDQENIMYFSIPWGGSLANLYNKVMTVENDASDVFREVRKIAERVGVNRFYFIFTNNWMPSPEIMYDFDREAEFFKNINNQVLIYQFNVY